MNENTQLTPIKPIVPRPGGKSGLLDDLGPVLDAGLNGRRYWEPFVGGAAAYLSLPSTRRRGAVLGDRCPSLIGFYRVLADAPGEVHEALSRRLSQSQGDLKARYLAARDEWNGGENVPETPERAALYLFLVRSAYNGLWRVNRSGRMNTPFGGKRRAPDPGLDRVVQVGEALREAHLRELDALAYVEALDEADLVYLDPPYLQGRSEGSDFTAYTRGGWDEDDLTRLVTAAVTAGIRGARVILSQPDHEFAHERLTPIAEVPHAVRRVSARCSISASARSRRLRPELLVTIGWRPACWTEALSVGDLTRAEVAR